MAQAHLLELWPATCAGAAFLTTFTLDPDYFELALLPDLLKRGAWPIVLFADLGAGAMPAMEQVEALREAGRSYLLVPVDLAPFAFHPKVHLFARDRVVVVGSGNLTPSGCGGNLEIAEQLTAAVDGGAVAAVRGFFRTLFQDPRCRMAPADRTRLTALLPEAEDPSGGDALFLHTLGPAGRTPLSIDWVDRLLDQPATQLLAAAPFIDPDNRTLGALVRALRPRHARLAADALHARPVDGVQPSRLQELTTEGGASRTQHAKLVHVVTAETSCVVSGSANLTDAAWMGRNVEAVVVRRALDARGFDSLFDDVEVAPSSWRPAPPESKTEPEPAVPSILARWARAEGGGVVLCVDRVPGMVAFVETEGRRTQLSLEPSAPGEERAPLATMPRRSAVIRCRAEGYRDALVVLTHLSRPPTPGGSRVRRDLDDLVAGTIDDDRVDDLRSRLFEFLRSAADTAKPPPGPAVASPVPATPARGTRRDSADDASFPVLEVEEILSGAGSGAGSGVTHGRELRQLIAALVAPRTSPSPPAPPRGDASPGEWTPADIAGTGHATEGDPEEDSGASSSIQAAEADDPEDTPAGKMSRDVAAFIEHCDASRLAPGPAIVLALQGAVHDILALTDASKVGASNARSRAVVALRVLARAWAVPEWPKADAGWVTHAGVDDSMTHEAVEVLVSALRLTGAPSQDDVLAGVGPVIRDQAARILQGLEALGPTKAAGHGDLLAAVRAHVPRDQAAVGSLSALWELELAAREVERISALVAPVRKALGDAELTCRTLSRRNQKHKDAVARTPMLSSRLASLERALSASSSRVASAATTLRAAPPRGLDGPDVVASWNRSGPTGRVPRRRLASRRDGADSDTCPGCSATLAAQVVEAMRDPGLVTRCTSCTILIAAGPPPGVT